MSKPKQKKGVLAPLEGRGLAMAVVALISGLSFSLGFFVGRASSPVGEVRIVDVDQGAQADLAEISEEEPMPKTEEPPSQVQPPAQPPAQAEAQPRPDTAERETPAQPARKKVSAKTPARKFSVQIAAFENRKDAELLQLKFKEKGYKTYIIKSRTDDRQTVYKVRVGSFATRDEAELLSIRLKNAEGISSFVTNNTP